ncbi:IclR family transcriptional regulator [Murinocardiopsis flavida]|uniref:Glycerol operon regulatory protein n=1 Tax=Murinocardiopsis flavida TaxID=645275 RepID=A0A2P8CXE3_9ACTN|nr:IclR family transcriptional regulator [Murinocardiopsis flavida]PSK89630.1 IclR family transcriptional regulator [Murinocardiopsis flavida]
MKPLETVDRALQVLQVFDQDHRELGVGELAASLGIHHSSASRLAATLALRGFLERSADSERYRVGPELRRLGLLGLTSPDLLNEARPIMDALVERVGETVALSQVDGDRSIDIAEAPGRHVIGARQWLGRRFPLHATSDGKVFLAFAVGRPAALETELERYTEWTITDPSVLAKALDRVRERGWAYAGSEFEEGLAGVAAPVFDAAGRCVAALNITGPDYRMPKDPDELGTACRAAADRITTRLGGP